MEKENLEEIRKILLDGIVIPAHPLTITEERKIDEKHQRALTRYYLHAGARGIAIGVHTTQFAIREHGLYRPVLEITNEEIKEFERETGTRIIKIAGVLGKTLKAVSEAKIAKELGYDAVLLKLDNSIIAENNRVMDITNTLIEHCKEIANIIPIFGFYLQPTLGGILLPFTFWKRFIEEIENVIAIKIATFNRYLSIDVVRALVESGREKEVALYTGNDDNIIQDLITPFSFKRDNNDITIYIRGGLLGQWAVWTRRAVEILESIKDIRNKLEKGDLVETIQIQNFMKLNVELTDANGAIFDAHNNYRGTIPGVLEVLRREGLVQNNLCLNPKEVLSEGQLENIERVINAYPHLTDQDFVKKHLQEYLR